MKALLVLIVLALAVDAFALSCGESNGEKSFRALNWQKIGDSLVTSTFKDVRAVLCAGVNRATNKIERMIYRDETGLDVNNTVATLKTKDIIVVKKSDLPSAAQFLVRNVPILTMKIDSETVVNGNPVYSMSFKFLRNIAKGFTSADIRDLKFNVIYNGSRDTTTAVQGDTTFDALQLDVSGSLKISNIGLDLDGRRMKNIETSEMITGERVL